MRVATSSRRLDSPSSPERRSRSNRRTSPTAAWSVVWTGDHDLFVGRVTETWFDPEFYDEARLFQGEAPMYLGRSACVKTTRERAVFGPEGLRVSRGK